MSITVRIPAPLQAVAGNRLEVEADGGTIAELLADLDNRFPGFRQRVYDETGRLRRFLNVYVNQEDIRFLSGETTPIKDGDEVSIVPAVAGG
ncbi:MoaD family protein [bacterium]|nr:MoaD family protein [bacterium]